MSELFLQADVSKLLHNKFVVIMGSSVQRSMYKDLVKILKKDKYLTDPELRAKGEAKFENDRLIEGGILSNNVLYREVREYRTDYHLIRFYFITKTYNHYVESVVKSFNSEPKPDVLLLNSCLWDITRYGLGPESFEGYRQNLHKLMMKLKTELDPNCLVLWNSTLPVDKEAKGGVFVPEVESAKTQLGAKILACNLIAHTIIRQYNYDFIDLHYYLRYHLHRRAEDGVHWDMTAHRRMTNLILFQIAEAWGLKKSEPTPSPTDTPHGAKAAEDAQVTTSSKASPSALTKALHSVAKTTKSSLSLTYTALKAVTSTLSRNISTSTSTVATTSTSVVAASICRTAANNSTTASEPAAITSTITSGVQPLPHSPSTISSIGPIKTKKKKKRKKKKKDLDNQENTEVSSDKKAIDSGPHPYNKPHRLKPQSSTNQTGPPIQQRPPFNGPENQQGPPFSGPPNQQRPQFNGPPNQQRPQFNGPSNQQRPPFNGPPNQQRPPFNGPPNQQRPQFNGQPNQQRPPFNGPPNQQRPPFNGPPNQQRPQFNGQPNQQYHQRPFIEEQYFHDQENAHYYEEGHNVHYNIQHIEQNLNQMNNALYKDYNVNFGNYDFTKDVDFTEGNYQDNGQHQHQGYEWREYLQNDGGFTSYNNHVMASRRRYRPYSRYQANRELYGGSRYQH